MQPSEQKPRRLRVQEEEEKEENGEGETVQRDGITLELFGLKLISTVKSCQMSSLMKCKVCNCA